MQAEGVRLHGQSPADSIAYVLPAQADYEVSPNFHVREFVCRDGSQVCLVHPVLAVGLEEIRKAFGRPVWITSGWRSGAHNAAIGGAPDSKHLYGMAADVKVAGAEPVDVYEEACRLGFGGVGQYPSWTHVDVFGRDRRW